MAIATEVLATSALKPRKSLLNFGQALL